MKLQEYFLYAKKTKIMTLFNKSSSLRQRSTILENTHWAQTAYAVLCQPRHTLSMFKLHNVMVEPLFWDYSDDVFHTFLGLDKVNSLAVNGTVPSFPVFLQNILNCVTKTNEASYGFGTT